MKLETKLRRLPVGSTLEVDAETTVECTKSCHISNKSWVCSYCAFHVEEGANACPLRESCFATHRPDRQSVYFKRVKLENV